MTNTDFPALDGRPVTQAHADKCARDGHAAHKIDGVDTGVCPRCGAVTEGAPALELAERFPVGARVRNLRLWKHAWVVGTEVARDGARIVQIDYRDGSAPAAAAAESLVVDVEPPAGLPKTAREDIERHRARVIDAPALERTYCVCGHKRTDHKAEPALDGRTGCRAANGLARCYCTRTH